MRLQAVTTRSAGLIVRRIALGIAVLGTLHFGVSLVAWGLFYFGSYRQGRSDVLAVGYGVRHLSSAVVFLAVFLVATATVVRRRRWATVLLAGGVVGSVVMFAVEVRGEPQFQRVWFDEASACSNRQSFFCTWWLWHPTRHRRRDGGSRGRLRKVITYAA